MQSDPTQTTDEYKRKRLARSSDFGRLKYLTELAEALRKLIEAEREIDPSVLRAMMTLAAMQLEGLPLDAAEQKIADALDGVKRLHRAVVIARDDLRRKLGEQADGVQP